jgi:hypothetical protein
MVTLMLQERAWAALSSNATMPEMAVLQGDGPDGLIEIEMPHW